MILYIYKIYYIKVRAVSLPILEVENGCFHHLIQTAILESTSQLGPLKLILRR